MARAHEVAIGADGRDFERGIRQDVIKPVDDAARALDDLGDDGTRDLGKLEGALKDIARQAPKTERAVKDVGDKGFKQASESTKAFKEEAVSNFSEVASSFSGDITEMADGVQGLTGGLASSLTPGIGIPIAIVGALAGAFLTSWIEASEDSEQRVEDMFARMQEAGSAFLTESKIKEAIEDLDTDQLADGLERAKNLSLDQGAVLRAMVGDQRAISGITDELARRRREETESIKDSGESIEDQRTKIDAVNTKYAESTDWLRDIQRDTGKAADKWDAVAAAVDWTSGRINALNGKVQGLSKGIRIPITIDSGGAEQEFERMRRNLQGKGIRVPIAAFDPRNGRTVI